MNRIALLAAVLAAGAGEAAAQTEPRITRGDLAGTIGWLSADTHPSGPYNDNNWANSFFTAASVGWHWTDKLKTEVDFGAGTKARVFSTETITIDGRIAYFTTDSKFARRTFGISQQYQFFHNAGFIHTSPPAPTSRGNAGPIASHRSTCTTTWRARAES